MLNPYFKLVRPANWIKNLIIVFPLFLGRKFNLHDFVILVAGLISFSLMASVGYILNDIRDVDRDRLHVLKKYRPIASGDAKVKISFILSIILFITSSIISLFISMNALIILYIYFSINYFYTIKGKDLRFIDILILTSFYLIRVIYGGAIINVPLTGWFIATLTMIVFSISLNKRYMELKISDTYKLPGRKYTRDDESVLHALMINFSVAALVLLNIHAYFVLQIQDFYFYSAINILTPGIILFYFDISKNSSDDPVEKIRKNKGLLLITSLLLMLYYYEIVIK